MRFCRQEVLRILRNVKNRHQCRGQHICLNTLTLVLTDKCNLRCRICDIWQKSSVCELEQKTIEKLLSAKSSKNLKHVALTGGEPFLRDDLIRIYEKIKRVLPFSKIIIATNGVLTEKIINFLNNIDDCKNIRLELSINSLSDEMTGVKGSFSRTDKTVKALIKEFHGLNLSAKFVISPWNYKEIKPVLDYCSENKLRMFVKLIENLKHYTNSVNYFDNLNNRTDFTPEQSTYIINSLRKIKGHPLINSWFLEKIEYFLQGNKVIDECFAPFKSIFVNSDGEAYLCRRNDSIGNIKGQDLDDILINKAFFLKRKKEVCLNCLSIFRYLI